MSTVYTVTLRVASVIHTRIMFLMFWLWVSTVVDE